MPTRVNDDLLDATLLWIEWVPKLSEPIYEFVMVRRLDHLNTKAKQMDLIQSSASFKLLVLQEGYTSKCQIEWYTYV